MAIARPENNLTFIVFQKRASLSNNNKACLHTLVIEVHQTMEMHLIKSGTDDSISQALPRLLDSSHSLP